jgi:hypothetical protein
VSDGANGGVGRTRMVPVAMTVVVVIEVIEMMVSIPIPIPKQTQTGQSMRFVSCNGDDPENKSELVEFRTYMVGTTGTRSTTRRNIRIICMNIIARILIVVVRIVVILIAIIIHVGFVLLHVNLIHGINEDTSFLIMSTGHTIIC